MYFSNKLSHLQVLNTTSYCHLNRAVPILQLYFDEAADHRQHLRLSLRSIMSLIAAVRLETDHGWERDIEVLVFLFWLAHAASYRVVSQTFDIPKTSVDDIVHRVSKAIMGILRRVIYFPTGDDLEAVGAGFAQLAGSPAFSRAVGAIDGCHVRIKPPANNSHCYFKRKLFHSIQLQAITDHCGKFLDVFVGYPGSVHDARVLRNSPVYTGSLYPPAGKCILGDGGYPCLSAPVCLITPYREPVQNPVQARFNSKHSRARSIVERAFGMMKTRWRSIFFKALEVSPAFVPEVITCCVVLHNLALLNGDIIEAEDEEDLNDGPPEPHILEARVGEHVQDNLAAAVSPPNINVPALHEHDYL
ncbi:putative nuclease HARBI1 [Pseudorasbora parva]|uniref:putative nuclease HARBI1 n=1 Tax=Pseudorasbora parva TaxID=51549 RepID=UPI00351F3E9C